MTKDGETSDSVEADNSVEELEVDEVGTLLHALPGKVSHKDLR